MSWCVARQVTPIHYVIGISGILPYNRNVTLKTLEPFSAYARLYNAAASPASRLRSAGSLAIKQLLNLALVRYEEFCRPQRVLSATAFGFGEYQPP